MFVLLQKLRHIHAGGDPENYVIPDEALEAFMQHCNEQIGAAYFQTPRNTIKEFLSFLAILEQNPEVSWEGLIGEIEVESEGIDTSQTEESESAGDDEGDDLAGFKLCDDEDDSRQTQSFELLHESMQRWVWKQGWEALRPIQEQAIPVVLDGGSDVILSAPTASGKTEAAFLPVLSHITDRRESSEAPEPGFDVVYISP